MQFLMLELGYLHIGKGRQCLMFVEFGLGHFEFFLTEIMQPYCFNSKKKQFCILSACAGQGVSLCSIKRYQVWQKYNLEAGKNK